jgi:hypothetical protein
MKRDINDSKFFLDSVEYITVLNLPFVERNFIWDELRPYFHEKSNKDD